MRRVYLGTPISEETQNVLQWLTEAMAEVERASQDDATEVFDAYTVTNFTETRTLDATAATLANVANFLCTLLDDLKNRGTKRNQ